MPRVLLINPWIYDFAAYNYWCEPLGLLSIGSVLRQAGYSVCMVDCLHGSVERPHDNGTGRFLKVRIPKPGLLNHVPRYFGRYGIPVPEFQRRLSRQHKPDVVLVTSAMTYWYPGVFFVIRCVKQRWPGTPILLGGSYATLCPDHARKYAGAHGVVCGEADTRILPILETLLGSGADSKDGPTAPCRVYSRDFDHPGDRPASGCSGSRARAQTKDLAGTLDSPDPARLPIPAHELRWEHLAPAGYIGVETSRGCPFRCSYCASHRLHPGFRRRPVELVVEEIEHYRRRWGIRHVAFFDDALLFEAKEHAVPLLDTLLQKDMGCCFHTPNGVHARTIDRDLACMMYRAGFRTLRLGLEFTDPHRQKETGGKITNEEFEGSVSNLKQAGFTAEHLAAYILVGLPGQTVEEISQSIRFVHARGIQARIAEFSPLPRSGIAQGAGREGVGEGGEDPLLHNNSVLSMASFRNEWRVIEALKQEARQGNRRLLTGGSP